MPIFPKANIPVTYSSGIRFFPPSIIGTALHPEEIDTAADLLSLIPCARSPPFAYYAYTYRQEIHRGYLTQWTYYSAGMVYYYFFNILYFSR